MPYIIEDLFETIIYSATEMRKRFHTLKMRPDRMEYWKQLLNIFEPLQLQNIPLGRFPEQDTNVYNTIMKLPEKTVDGLGNEQLIESNHLLIELVRIPSIYHLSNTVMRLLYLAFVYSNYNGLSHSERTIGCMYEVDITEEELNRFGNIENYVIMHSTMIKFSEDALLDDFKTYNIGSVSDICHKIRELFQKNIMC